MSLKGKDWWLIILIVKYNIRITSIMENFKDELQVFDTASSGTFLIKQDFYPKKHEDMLKSGVSSPKNVYSDRCLVEVLFY